MDRRHTHANVKEKVGSQPSRISRLVQPRKYSATPHSLNRHRSVSTENVASYNRKVTKRARSANPHAPTETPVRLPLARSLSSLFTPASTSKSLRKPTNENTIRILDVLRKHFGPTFLPGGLQSMTAKQFVEIVRFFAQNICGDKIVIQDNNVDDVKRFVDFIEYPHQMNKSWFKAPTVSIAYDRNVEFLDWLCDFVSLGGDDGHITDGVEYKNVESNDFVNQEFAGNFIADLRNGFVIWSDQNAEFDDWKAKWTCNMITARTGLDDIDVAMDRIDDEYKSLQTNGTHFDNESLLQTQQKKNADLSALVSKMRATVDEKLMDLQETTSEVDQLSAKRVKLTNQVIEMKETIKNQRFSADDRTKVTSDLNYKKHFVKEKRDYVDSIKSIANENQVKIARLRMQKTKKILIFNEFIQKLFQMGISFGDVLTLTQLSVHENATKDEIKAKLDLLDQIKEVVNKRRADIRVSLNEVQSKLSSTSNQLFVIEDEIATHKKHLHSVEIQYRKIENEIADTKYNSEQQQLELQMKIDDLVEKYEQIDMKLKLSEKLAQSLREENKKIFQGIELQSKSLLDAKRERQARQEAAIEVLEQLTEQLKVAVKDF